MALVLGIDSSTQSVKAEVRDVDSGRLVASGRAAHPTTTPPRSEQSPDAWWAALRDAVAEAGNGVALTEVEAIAIAGQQHGMVVLDATGDVIRDAKLWNDTQSAPQASALVDRLGADVWAATCGSVPVAAFTVTKLAWLRENEPDSYARTRSVLLPHDWLTYRLTGARTTDRGDASGTGYWSPHNEAWAPELLQAVDPDRDWLAALPAVRGPWEPAGTLSAVAAEALSLRPGIIVGAGTGDNMAAALGLGLAPGDVTFSLGTSGTVYAVSDRPTADVSGAVAGFGDATGHFLPLVCTLNATKVFDAVARLLGVALAEFDRLAGEGTGGANGVTLVPYFDGERTPNRPAATGLLSGVRSDVSRADFARAAIEGVICGLLDGYDAILAATGRTSIDGRLLLIGGGAKSATARQVLANLTSTPVIVPAAEELVALGACVQAAAVLCRGSVPTWSSAELGDGSADVVVAPSDSPGAVRAKYAVTRDLR